MAKIILFAGDIGNNPVRCLMLSNTAPYPEINNYGFNDITSSVIVISGKWRLWEGNIGDTTYASYEVDPTGGPDHDGVYPYGHLPIGNDTLSAVELVSP